MAAARQAARGRATAASGRQRRALAWLVMAAAHAVGPASARGAASALEPARVRVAARLVDDAVRGLLPVEMAGLGASARGWDGGVAAMPGPAVLTQLHYCGVTDRGAGRFRAVVQSGGTGNAGGGSLSPLAGDAGCAKNLDDLAKRAATGDLDIVIADLEAVWRPWELRFTVVRTSGTVPPKPGQPQPMAGADGRHDALTVSTAGLRMPTEAGPPLVFHVAPTFAADAIDLAVVVGDGGTGAPSRAPTASQAAALAAGATVAADLPFAFVNQVLRQLTGGDPLPIPIDRDVVDVQNAQIVGGASGVSVTATATPRSLREPVHVTAQTAGADLRVMGFKAEGSLETCTGLGTLATIGCGTRNAARNGAAAALGAAMTARYQGQLVRDLAGTQLLRFDVGGRSVELRGDLAHVAPGARGLSATARLEAGEPGH